MQVSVTFAIPNPKKFYGNMCREKISKLKKYLDSPLEANVVLAIEKHRHIAEVTLIANRITINAQEDGVLFAAIDRVSDKLEQQILNVRKKSNGIR